MKQTLSQKLISANIDPDSFDKRTKFLAQDLDIKNTDTYAKIYCYKDMPVQSQFHRMYCSDFYIDYRMGQCYVLSCKNTKDPEVTDFSTPLSIEQYKKDWSNKNQPPEIVPPKSSPIPDAPKLLEELLAKKAEMDLCNKNRAILLAELEALNAQYQDIKHKLLKLI